MKPQDAAGLLDTFGVLVGAVAGGHDFFGYRTLKVRTPIGDHAIRGVGRVSFAAVPDDGVKGDTADDGDIVDRHNKRIGG